MRLLILALLQVFLAAPNVAYSQKSPKAIAAFKPGEKLVYRVYYHSALTGSLTAGEAVLEVKPQLKTISGREVFHVIARGKTAGAFNFFYKVNDRFESWIDTETILPWLFIRRINENGYIRDEDLVFDRKRNRVVYKNNLSGLVSEISVPSAVHDVVSAIYFARSIDPATYSESGGLTLPFVFSDSLYSSTILYAGREPLKIASGVFNCIKIKPGVLKGNVFDESYPLTVWVTDDKNKIPVMAESRILVGSVKMELISWSGLLYPR